jgi:amidase
MIAIEGHVSSFGHPRWRETHAPATDTAPVVSGLLAAGASVAGLAKLDQLAWSIVGNAGEGVAPRNPLYPDRFTGGSSSGPAAAVAGGLADAGIGTDTGGSIRVPAAACGLFGLRTTHGLISTEGVLPLAPSFDVVGFLARGLGHLGQLLEVLTSGPAPAADTAGPAHGPAVLAAPRVVVPADGLAVVSTETAEAVRAVASAIASSGGSEPEEDELGAFFNNDVADLFARIQARQVWAAHGPWLAQNMEVLAPDVADRARRGEKLSAAPRHQQDDDRRAWHAYTAALGERLPPGTIAVLPVMPGLAPMRTAAAADLQAFRLGAFRFTTPASLSGRPELVIPVRHLPSGQQIGVGILGPRGADAELIRLAARVR